MKDNALALPAHWDEIPHPSQPKPCPAKVGLPIYLKHIIWKVKTAATLNCFLTSRDLKKLDIGPIIIWKHKSFQIVFRS